jgi:hypothetical protein
MMQKLMLALLGVAIAVALLQAIAGADSGLHFIYYCDNGIKYRREQWGNWVGPDSHSFYWHHHVTYVGKPIAVNVCY